MSTPIPNLNSHSEQDDSKKSKQDQVLKKVMAKTSKQIAKEYGISTAVFRRWRKAITDLGDRVGHFFSKDQVLKIYRHYGYPDGYLAE